MEKINIAEILKDCPKGMELDCVMYDNNVQLDTIQDGNAFPIKINTPEGRISLSKYGCCSLNQQCKCVIFPKGKTTWEGFKRPFKDGDVLAYQHPNNTNPSIYIHKYTQKLNTAFYVALNGKGYFYVRGKDGEALFGNVLNARFATEEEQEKLFKAIKDNGYKWNAETKTLEKLITLKFKIGDMIRVKGTNYGVKIVGIKWDQTETYYETSFYEISVKDQDNYELVPNKFDITTLVPFESRVLVRDCESEKWSPAIWGFKSDDIDCPYEVVSGNVFAQCIPFEGNQHLLGTTDDCDDFYKTWEQYEDVDCTK